MVPGTMQLLDNDRNLVCDGDLELSVEISSVAFTIYNVA